MKRIELLLTLLLLCQSMQSQWSQTNGPYIGNATSFATVGSTIFAGTSLSGVYKSTDNGMSWQTASGSFLGPAPVLALVTSGGRLIAGTDHNGVKISTDMGANWIASSSGPDSIRCFSTGGTDVLVGSTAGIYVSTNNGVDWTSLGSGLATSTVNAIVFSGSTLYAGTDGGVFISTDNGTTWNSRSAGLVDRNIQSLAVLGSTLFCGTSTHGVFTSSDAETTWVASNSGLTNLNIHRLTVFGNNVLVGTDGGVFRSIDGGLHWIAPNTGPMNRTVYCVGAAGPNLFSAASYLQCFFSSDSGATWTEYPRVGLPNTRITSLASDGTILYAGTEGYGIFRSSDDGVSWEQTALQWYWIWQLEFMGSKLFATTGFDGAYSTTNGGDTWVTADSGIPTPMILSVQVAGARLFTGTGQGVFCSFDSGTSWTNITTKQPSGAITRFAVLGEDLFAATTGWGTYRSTDHGTTWESIGPASYYQYWVGVIGTALLAPGRGTIYRSTNEGANWSASSIGGACFCPVGLNAFVGEGSGEVYLSTDTGITWSSVGWAGAPIDALVGHGEYVFVGTRGLGVWKRPLSEMTGILSNRGLPEAFRLNQNYPNPFNSSTNITYDLPQSSMVRLVVFDILGREVSVLVNEKREAGVHEVLFDGSGLASGIYFYRIQAGSFVQTRKLLLLK